MDQVKGFWDKGSTGKLVITFGGSGHFISMWFIHIARAEKIRLV